MAMVLIHQLPRDVRSIIYRLLFESDYSRLRNQYRDVWLTGKYIWYDTYGYFTTNDSAMAPLIANWRNLDIGVIYSKIYSFEGPSVGQYVPRRYGYSCGVDIAKH